MLISRAMAYITCNGWRGSRQVSRRVYDQLTMYNRTFKKKNRDIRFDNSAIEDSRNKVQDRVCRKTEAFLFDLNEDVTLRTPSLF